MENFSALADLEFIFDRAVLLILYCCEIININPMELVIRYGILDTSRLKQMIISAETAYSEYDSDIRRRFMPVICSFSL